MAIAPLSSKKGVDVFKRSVVYASVVLCTVTALVFGATLPAGAAPAVLRPVVVTVGDVGVPAEVLAAARELANAPGAGTVMMRPSGAKTLATGPEIIECFGRAQYPHPSSGLPGSVDSKAESWCTYPVSQIQAQATLYEYLSGYGFVLAGRSTLQYEQNTAGTITAVAFAICVGSPRYFVGTGYHFFVAPPYYRPATLRMDSATPVVTVSC
jgi:hypothetical protein